MLQAATFHILLALADEDRHGLRPSFRDVAARTGGELKLSAGTLYRSIQRMLEQGLIVETRERPAPRGTTTSDGPVFTGSRRKGAATRSS